MKEDRKAQLDHENGSITCHYSAAELGKLIDEANRISATDSRTSPDSFEEDGRLKKVPPKVSDTKKPGHH
jgi:hypothetical protein